jgi:hypothetical protein
MPKSRQLPKDENDVMRRQHELAQELERHHVMPQLADLARVPKKIEKARQYFSGVILNRQDGELWESDRLIARFPDPNYFRSHILRKMGSCFPSPFSSRSFC